MTHETHSHVVFRFRKRWCERGFQTGAHGVICGLPQYRWTFRCRPCSGSFLCKFCVVSHEFSLFDDFAFHRGDYLVVSSTRAKIKLTSQGIEPEKVAMASRWWTRSHIRGLAGIVPSL